MCKQHTDVMLQPPVVFRPSDGKQWSSNATADTSEVQDTTSFRVNVNTHGALSYTVETCEW